MIRLVATQRLYSLAGRTSCRIATATSFIPTVRRLTTTAVCKLDKDDKSIKVNWSKGNDSWSKFHFDWLRDNCPCPKCKHPEYEQRLLITLEDPIPVNVDVKGSEAVKIEWRDGHHSQYPYSWLLANSYCHNNVTKETGKKRKITLWDSNSTVTANPPEMSYNDIMTDDGKLLTLLRNLYEYGFCFILDTPTTGESMVEAAKRVGPIQNSCYGQQWFMEVGVKLTVKHFSYTAKQVIPHTDSVSLYDSPGTTWAHVIECKDVIGAYSSLIDGFKIAECIRKQEPEYFSLLNKVSIPHQLLFNKGEKDEGVYRTRRHTFTVDNDNEMSAVHLNNIDRKPLDEISLSEAKEVLSCDADEAITKMYQALRYLHNLVMCDDQFVYKFDLEPGRMILLNNHRMFHGRSELMGGFRIICGLHNGEAEWLSKLEILEHRYKQ